jgi:hypothetical protein
MFSAIGELAMLLWAVPLVLVIGYSLSKITRGGY